MDASPPPPRRRRRLGARIAAGAVAVALLLALTVATMPLGWLRGAAERALSAQLGRTVAVGSVARLDAVSFSPRIAIRDVRIAQPAWAGTGDMVRLSAATIRLPLIPALFGRIRPREAAIDGLRLVLVRDAGGRENWRRTRGAGGDSPIAALTLRDARFSVRDDRRRVAFAGAIAADARGVRIDATGTHRRRPATLRLRGAPIASGARWPFRAAFASPLARLTLDGSADAPLDVAHFTARATAAGQDLAIVDDVIGAGLPGTQAVRLAARVRHDAASWRIGAIRGTIGRSDVAGDLAVDRRDGRSIVTGTLVANRLDFDDLNSDDALAKGAAKRARIGKRLIPDTPIDLARLMRTDGRLEVRAHTLFGRGSAGLRSLSAVLALDHGRLTVAPLTIALDHGRLEGRATVTQRAAGPLLAIDLRLVDGQVEDILERDVASAPMHGRFVLTGTGRTVRDALVRADGTAALASPGGSVRRTVAEALGRNAGAAVGAALGDAAARLPLRCGAARFRVRRGVATPEFFTIDTAVSRAEGHGRLFLNGERMDVTLDGRSKHPGLAQLPSPISLRGTISSPALASGNGGLGSAKTILRTVGSVFKRLVEGKHDPAAPDVDCAALLRRAG